MKISKVCSLAVFAEEQEFSFRCKIDKDLADILGWGIVTDEIMAGNQQWAAVAGVLRSFTRVRARSRRA